MFPQSEDVSAQRASTPQPVAPPPQPVPSISEVNFTREQVIRQQLLAKQKQLLELQQKKIELELEHTKAQLVLINLFLVLLHFISVAYC